MGVEILSMLKAKGGDLSLVGCGGLPDITPQDVLAAMAMSRSVGGKRIKLDRAAYDWGRFLVLQDSSCRDSVAHRLGMHVFNSLQRNGQQFSDGEFTIGRLAGLVDLAMHERVNPRLCRRCNGGGCDVCGGSGVKTMSLVQRAAVAGMDKKTWRKRQTLHEELLDVAYQCLGSFECVLNLNLKTCLLKNIEAV